ncbi:MAG: VWA domain-containing protein [Candidatus Omnitrophica bacterium]|nr:VWA domain-containing protein [Candidatus Omnitrophota bacterium]
MEQIYFKDPIYFLLLLLLPLLAIWLKRQKRASLRLSSSEITKAIKPTLRTEASRHLKWLPLITFTLLVIAIARPQSVESEREFNTEGIDIMMCLDISGSMMAEDFQPENRLAVAKEEAKKFIAGRSNDRIGLVVFSRHAYTQCPLTLDYNVLDRLIDNVHIGMIEDGTAIGMALGTATNRLRDSKAKSKIIILITDGENNSGKIDPITAAELAKSFNIKVYAIGVGRGGLVPFPIDDPLMGRRYVQARVDVDEPTLKRIADLTGGLYFRARDPGGLAEIYKKINQLERTEIKVKEYRNYDELFFYPLVGALILFAAWVGLDYLWLIKIP